MSDRKYMDIAEFSRLGFLQEANRQFFHPHGLALEVTVEEDGREWISGVWDERDDPEGIVFGADPKVKIRKHLTTNWERDRHREARRELFGTDSDIEPLGWIYPDEDGKTQ